MKLPAIKDKLKPKLPAGGKFTLSGPLLWRLAFGGMAALIVVLAVVVWMSGSRETRHAVDEGRRVLIRLDNSAIEGHPLTLDHKETPPATDAATPPAEKLPAEKPAATDAKPDKPAPDTAPAAAPSTLTSAAETTPVASTADAVITPAAVAPAAPNPDLSEKADVGMLPIHGKDGTKPWRYYARPYERKGSLPMIAIIVSGLGESKDATVAATKLPPDVSLSFSPYAPDVASQAATARVTGHEILIDLPLEPSNYPTDDPGPYGLIVGKGPEENEKRLQWLMSRFSGYVGFLTPQTEAFTSNAEALKALLQSLSTRELLLVAGRGPAKDDTRQMLQTSATANVIADTLIDEDPSPSSIQTRLSSLEQIAKDRGYAVGIAQAYPVTMQQIATWAAKLEADGFVLAPVTFVARLHAS